MRIAGRPTPRLVRRVFLPASFAVFFLGLAGSSAIFFQRRPFDLKAAIISDLESPDENPRGYGAGAAGTAACGLLLAPAGLVFFDRLRAHSPKAVLAGALLFDGGIVAAAAIGLLAPFTHGYTPLHVQLAYAGFIGICAGTTVLLPIASTPARGQIAPNRSWRRIAAAVSVLNGAVLLFLLYLYFGPNFFDNKTLLTSLAFCEWMLCADCAVSLWILAGLVERNRKT